MNWKSPTFQKWIIHYIISDDDLNRLKRIETLNEQGSTNGPEMPMALSDHCIITLDSNTLLTTGGISNVESSHFRNKKPSWSCWCTSPFSSAHAYRKALRRPLARSVYLNAPPLVLRIWVGQNEKKKYLGETIFGKKSLVPFESCNNSLQTISHETIEKIENCPWY